MDARFRRFSLFYFCYYAALGAFTPYVGRWVDAMGHGGYVVGGMLGLWYASRIISPPAWSALLQRSSRPGHWFVAACVGTLACFSLFTLTHRAVALFAVMSCFGLVYNAVMPQFEAMTLAELGPRSAEYGRIRVWGSVGFLLVASSYGWLLDRVGDASFPWITLPLFLAMVLASWPHRFDRPPEVQASVSDAGHLWNRPGVRRFLLVAMLMQMGFGAFYVFYTLHLQANGQGGAAIGALWGTGVLIEILMFWQAPRLIHHFGAPRLMSFCMAVTVLRWTAIALFATQLPLMFAAQTLHAFSFAIFHACCMRQMSEYFPGHRAAAGQSLLYGFSSGVGGVLGAALSAVMWDHWGGRGAFLAGAGVTALAWLVYALRRTVPAQAGSDVLASPTAD